MLCLLFIIVTKLFLFQTKTEETLDIGQKLVELGFAKASLPQHIKKNSIESKIAPVLLNAENRAKNLRNGIWSHKLPPVPSHIVYWRKTSNLTKEIAVMSSKKLLEILVLLSKGALIGMKNLATRPFKSNSKQMQAT